MAKNVAKWHEMAQKWPKFSKNEGKMVKIGQKTDEKGKFERKIKISIKHTQKTSKSIKIHQKNKKKKKKKQKIKKKKNKKKKKKKKKKTRYFQFFHPEKNKKER
jgi:hypothetical protein